ncbi:MAG TPA: CoA transferase [Dehalococcoidia bacterium]
MTAHQDAALGDVRVLDLTGPMGQYCTKLLADLGADVIRVEPPEGSPARRVGPFWHDEPDPNKSLSFFYFNTNKRSVTCNLVSRDGQALFRRLVPTADVVVSDLAPGELDRLGLAYHHLVELRPDIIVTSITGFGEWGVHAGYLAPDIVGVAMSGVMWLAGYPDAPPVQPPGTQGYVSASIQAAQGTLMALYHRDVTGQGQLVEVSMQEALSLSQETAMQFWDMQKVLRKRTGDEHRLPGIGTYACRDGYVFSMVGVPGFGAPWSVLCDWMAEEGMAEDLTEPAYQELFANLNMRELTRLAADPAALQERLALFRHVDEVLERFFLSKGKQELYEEGQARRLLIGPVNSPKDLAENKQLNARGYFVDVPHPELGTDVRYPGSPYRLSETPWRVRRRPPLLGEHNLEVYHGELGIPKEELATLAAAGAV